MSAMPAMSAMPSAETLRPGSFSQKSVPEQPRYQIQTEEHPGVGDSEDEEENGQ